MLSVQKGDWWNYSWNVAPGCSMVSEGCIHCWAAAMASRLQKMNKPGYEGLVYGRGQWTGRVNLLEKRLEEPLRLKRSRIIAVNLMGDLFHPEVPDEFIQRAFRTMALANWHAYILLSKRPERFADFVKRYGVQVSNAWFGTTVENQRRANERWSAMAYVAQSGWKTWVSSEPRLEAINWHGWEFLTTLATGGESGRGARPMAPAWARADRDWCQEHKIPFWFKQWGEWAPIPGPSPISKNGNRGRMIDESNYPMAEVEGELVFQFGRSQTGRLLDGQELSETAWMTPIPAPIPAPIPGPSPIGGRGKDRGREIENG